VAISRAIFREYDIRGIAGKDLTEEVATAVAGAFAAFLTEKGVRGAISVGRDNRPSGEGLHRALVAGLLASGVDVVDIGIVPTPLAYWSQHNLDVIGGIQITGSHNPAEYNGFKLGLGRNSIYGAEIQRIYDLAVAGKFPRGKGSLRHDDIVDRYVDDIAERVGRLSRDLKVIIDCGNGAGAVVAPKLFPRLGIKPRCLFCESDGTFPNHHPDPTVPKNLEDLIAAVKAKEPTADAISAIELLEHWDNTVAPESKGAVLFETWWADYSGLRPPNRTPLPDEKRFAKVWTADDPFNTPRGLADPDRAVASFVWAVTETARRYGSFDVAWGDVHRVRRGNVDVPVGGCASSMGCFRALAFSREPDGKLPRREAQQRDAWIHHRSRCTACTQRQRQGSQAELQRESADGEPQRVHHHDGSLPSQGHRRAGCGTGDVGTDSGRASNHGRRG